MRLLRLPLELACNRLTAALGGTMTGRAAGDRRSRVTRSGGLRQRVLMAAIYFVADSLNYLVADPSIAPISRSERSRAMAMPRSTCCRLDTF